MQFCPTGSGGWLTGAPGRRGSPRRRAKPHPSAGLVVRHVGVAYRAPTAIEWQAFSLLRIPTGRRAMEHGIHLSRSLARPSTTGSECVGLPFTATQVRCEANLKALQRRTVWWGGQQAMTSQPPT